MNVVWPCLLSGIFFFGCSDNASPDMTLGTLKGKTTLLGVDAKPLSSSSDGVTIHLEGTPFSAVTDINGEWQITKVPAGIYNIIEGKPGFATTIVPEYQFSGSGTAFLMSESLEQIPDSAPFSVEAVRSGSSNDVRLIIQGSISGSGAVGELWLMINPDSTLSVMAQPSDRWGSVNRFDSVSTARGFSDTIQLDRYHIQLKSGEKLYVRSLVRGAEYTMFTEPAARYGSLGSRAASPYVVHSVVIP